MHDVTDRLKMMDDCGIDVSILIPQPFIETAPNVFNNPVKALQAAQYINDAIAGIVNSYPTRFKGVALLPTNLPSDTANVTTMLGEFERAVSNGAVGACFIVSPTAKPPDHADYLQLYAKAVELNVPLWIHPSRPPFTPTTHRMFHHSRSIIYGCFWTGCLIVQLQWPGSSSQMCSASIPT